MNILGLMSGTSLDGLDMALCRFEDCHQFELLACATQAYPEAWRRRLEALHRGSAEEYAAADAELGHWMGQTTRNFVESRGLKVDCIASHGHTVFHQPQRGFTSQIGDVSAIYAETGIAVVGDFRRLDVALGGEGAPLVPIGDRLLFGDYDCCVNLGGIANISYETGGQRLAYDICPCNMLLNLLARRAGAPYDRDGLMARSGKVDTALLERLEDIDYYKVAPPKTLGKEWFERTVAPLVEGQSEVKDLLRTSTVHVARRVAAALPEGCRRVLVTGGGAHNSYLIELMRREREGVEVCVPDSELVDYKEAIIFALLGYLRLQGEQNCLRSVTGARCDSCGGVAIGAVRI